MGRTECGVPVGLPPWNPTLSCACSLQGRRGDPGTKGSPGSDGPKGEKVSVRTGESQALSAVSVSTPESHRGAGGAPVTRDDQPPLHGPPRRTKATPRAWPSGCTPCRVWESSSYSLIRGLGKDGSTHAMHSCAGCALLHPPASPHPAAHMCSCSWRRRPLSLW